MKYYEILQVKETDTIEVIKKNINHSLKNGIQIDIHQKQNWRQNKNSKIYQKHIKK